MASPSADATPNPPGGVQLRSIRRLFEPGHVAEDIRPDGTPWNLLPALPPDAMPRAVEKRAHESPGAEEEEEARPVSAVGLGKRPRLHATQAPGEALAVEEPFAGASTGDVTGIVRSTSADAASPTATPASWNVPLTQTRSYAGAFPGIKLVIDLFRRLSAEPEDIDTAIATVVADWEHGEPKAVPAVSIARLKARLKKLHEDLENPDVTTADVLGDLQKPGTVTDLQAYVAENELGSDSPAKMGESFRARDIAIDWVKLKTLKNIVLTNATAQDHPTLGQIYDKLREGDEPGAIDVLKRANVKREFSKWFANHKPDYEPKNPHKPIDAALRREIVAAGPDAPLGLLVQHDLADARVQAIIGAENAVVDDIRRQIEGGTAPENLLIPDARADSEERLVNKAQWLIEKDNPDDLATLTAARLDQNGGWTQNEFNAVTRLMEARRLADQPCGLDDVLKVLGVKLSKSKRSTYHINMKRLQGD